MKVNPPSRRGDSDDERPRQRRTQAERSATTRDALLRAARELFAERGYAGAGRELVAERAGVTRGALYHHFPNKEALFRAVVESVEEESFNRIATAAMSGSTPLDRLRLGCHEFLDSALEPDMQQIVLVDAPAVLGWEAWREIDARYGYALLREGVVQVVGDTPAAASSIEVLTHLLLGALNEAAFLVANAEQPQVTRLEVGATVDDLLERFVGGAGSIS